MVVVQRDCSQADRFLWTYAKAGSIYPETFVALVKVSSSLSFSRTCNKYLGIGSGFCFLRLRSVGDVVEVHAFNFQK